MLFLKKNVTDKAARFLLAKNMGKDFTGIDK